MPHIQRRRVLCRGPHHSDRVGEGMFGRREMKGHDSSAAERESDMRDLLELLPGCSEDHRTAR